MKTILINRRESRGRRMFDLAHELFHILTWDAMPPERVESREIKSSKGNRVEQLANNFASALLMPEPVVSATSLPRAAFLLDLTVVAFADLCRAYDVSLPHDIPAQA